MEAGDLEELQKLTERFVLEQGAMGEFYEVIDRISESRDPSALPALRLALSAALVYQPRAQALADTTPSEYKKGAAGGWMIDAVAHDAKEYVTKLRAAVEACTPNGEEIVYEPSEPVVSPPTVSSTEAAAQPTKKKRWWART